MEVRCKQLGYLQAFMDVINQTWPHGDHLLVNLASPGAFAADDLHVAASAGGCCQHGQPAGRNLPA